VPPSPEVIWPGASRPDADLFWSCPDLYSLAHRAFDRYAAVTPVRFEVAEHPVPDIVHWTCPMPVYAKGAINVVTVHDLIPLRLPHTTLDDKTTYAARLRASLDRADHIAVVSEQTRRDVVEWLGVDESKVTNTYQAVSLPKDQTDRPQSAVIEDLEGVLGLEWRGYYLYFGAIEPKKNVARIIEAHLASGVAAPLVIVGGRGWLNEDENALLNDIAAGAAPGRVRRFDYMPYPLLISLVRGARAVLFPSLYEGFGLPVLEAMALNTPVLTSTQGALPEVAGDAALLVDPYNVDAIKAGIRALDNDEGLRRHLAAEGLIQARKFSPDAYRVRLKGLYRRLGAT
jgi:glycosyltransferase involved in cell wall biosynthesis